MSLLVSADASCFSRGSSGMRPGGGGAEPQGRGQHRGISVVQMQSCYLQLLQLGAGLSGQGHQCRPRVPTLWDSALSDAEPFLLPGAPPSACPVCSGHCFSRSHFSFPLSFRNTAASFWDFCRVCPALTPINNMQPRSSATTHGLRLHHLTLPCIIPSAFSPYPRMEQKSAGTAG